jgi:serine phosphatase RsbU (regulator of sigma subunit)
VNAAAAMAQLRAALRAYLAVDPDPVAALTALTTMFDFYRMGGLATVLVALNDPESATVTFAGAGHLPPVVRRADGAVSVVELPACPPLGPLGRPPGPRTAVSVPIGQGDTYVMYTDGLVETREQDIDSGIAKLVDALAAGGGLDSEPDLRALAAGLVPPGQDDDVTLLTVHRA